MNVKNIGISLTDFRAYSYHKHNTWEIILNLNGEGDMFIEGKKYKFFPGSIICCPPDMEHYKTSNSTFRDIFIQVDYPGFSNTNEIVECIDTPEKSIEMFLFNLLYFFHKKENGYNVIADSIYNSIASIIHYQFTKLPKNDFIETIINIMIENLANPSFNSSDAYKGLNYNNDYIRRCFKLKAGVTPVNYLNKLRIDFAKNLFLLQSDGDNRSVADIAYNSGFYDPLYFSRVFKKITGKAPKEYKFSISEIKR